MKILLIWPKGYDTKYVIPISFGYFKSNLDQRHEVGIFDASLNNVSAEAAELKNIILKFEPELVCVSCWSPVYNEGLKILNLAKSINNKIVTVMGGAHVTSYFDEAISREEVDFILRSEAEISFNNLINHLETGNPEFQGISGLVYKDKNIIKTNEVKRQADLDKIKIPDYDFIGLESYLKQGYRYHTWHKRNAPVWVTRGCPYTCKFCTALIQNGRVIRKHSVEYVIEWIKFLYYKKNIKMINIIDDNFTFDTNYAKSVCREIIKLNLKDLHIGTPNGIRIERSDFELFTLMKKAGWESVSIAPESGSVKTLKRMEKHLDLKIVPGKIKEIKKAGLKVHGFFILGLPGDTKEDLKKTIRFMRKCRFNFIFMSNFQPLMGAPIYEALIQEHKISKGILPKNYSDGSRVYTPEEMKNINFPKIVLREYLYLILSNPANISYVFKFAGPAMMVQKVLANINSMFKKKRIQ